MSETHTLVVRNPIQAVLFNEVVKPALAKGTWKKTTPHGHAEPWQHTEAVPAKKSDEKELGVDFQPPRADYNLVKKEFVDAVAKKALKAVKLSTGEETTLREIRKELKDMMFIMRTPIGEDLAIPHHGMMEKPGRPSKEALAALQAKLDRAKSRIRAKRAEKPAATKH